MCERQDPGEQQGNRDDDEEVVNVDAGCIGTDEDGPKGEDGDERGAQKWHRGTTTDRRQHAATRRAAFLADENAVHDDNRVVDEHAHRQHEGCERDALQRPVETLQDEQRSHDDGDE